MEVAKIFFSNGIPLDCDLTIPDDITVKTYPVVILCHGHSRYRNDGLDRLAQILCENGIASLRFDFRGCGISATRRFHLYCTTEWHDDLINAISFVQSIPRIDSKRVGVAGISMGACTAVSVAGTDKRIKSVASMAGIADCEQWLKGVWERSKGDWSKFRDKVEEDHKLAVTTGLSQIVNVLEMYNDTDDAKEAVIIESLNELGVNAFVSLDSIFNLLRYKPKEQCKCIECKVFIAHGAKDTLVPIENALALYNDIAAEGKQIKIYEGIDHNIPRDQNRDIVFRDIVHWFANSL